MTPRRTVLILLLALATSACGGHRCTNRSNATGAGNDFSLRECWDGQDRQVTCTPAGAEFSCQCIVAGAVQRTAARNEPIFGYGDDAIRAVNATCGWDLAP